MERIPEPWHLLHLIEGEENVEHVDCRRCRKSVLGIPTYKCSDCKFFVHKSCGEEPNRGLEVMHDLSDVHHLTSTELGKDDAEKAVCSLCENRVPHSSNKNVSIYKCIIQNCEFLTHESCIALPVMMVFDDLHDPRHTFFLKSAVRFQRECRVCDGSIISGSFFYDCSKCFCKIHSKCATCWKDKANKCKPHKYISNRKPIEFTCDICGKKSSDMGLHCSECRLLIHTDCDQFIRDIKQTGHHHSLTFTLSLSQDKYHECKACEGMVSTFYGAYCCSEQECEYVFHLFCGYGIEQQGGANDPDHCPPYLVSWTGDRKDVGPKNHPSHPEHELIWRNEEPKDKVCQGCKESIFVPPFYRCGECEFCLHIRCALLPQQVTRPAYSSNPLSLHNAPSDVNESSFWCIECECLRYGFFYRLPGGYRRPFDIQCALIPDGFTHSLHKHQLFRGFWYGPICNACGIDSPGVRRFDCRTCSFKVCIKCLTLPLKARHKYDQQHFLKLVNTLKDNTNENYCQICEDKIIPNCWFYYCEQCDFSGHPPCVLVKKGP